MLNLIFYLEGLIPRQQVIIKSLIINMDNRFNKVFLSFSPFNYKFSPGNKLIDIFPNHFSFYILNRKSDNNIKSHLLKLNDLILQVLSDPQLVIIVTSSLWLKVFSYFNLLCARATRVIVNYASICHIQVHLSGKLYPCGDATSEPYKPASYGSHLSCNTSYGSAATLQVFRLPWWRYSYLTWSFMTE